MRINVKKIVTAVSLAVNGLFCAVLIMVVVAKPKTVLLSLSAPPDGYLTAATVVHFPASSALVFNSVDITLTPTENFFLQYSVITAGRQANVLITALYDPLIISVSQTEAGIEITGLREGQTLMQTVTNEGIKDIALITVTK